MNKPESEGTFADVAKYKWEQAKDDLETAEILLEAGKYKAANNPSLLFLLSCDRCSIGDGTDCI